MRRSTRLTKKEKIRHAVIVDVAKAMLEPALGARLVDQMIAAGLIMRACIDVGFENRTSRRQAAKEITAWMLQGLGRLAPSKPRAKPAKAPKPKPRKAA